jgi:4-amino-4-deoxy-L-arabinose transferase-like glycosyltransferase
MWRRPPRPLALLLGAATVLTVAWTFSTAPFQGPDEPAHFNYTQHLAETGHKPSVSTGGHPDSTQVGNALFYLNLSQLAGVSDARPSWTPVEEQRYQDIVTALGEKGEEDGVGPNPLAKNPPLYYAYQVVPYWIGSLGGFWDRLIVMRLASGLLFLVTVALTWFAAAEVFRSTWARLIAAGCVALLPQLTAISGTINADNLLIAVWAGFVFAALRLVRRGLSPLRILAVCALAAASLLTHGRGTAILPALAIAVLVALIQARPSLPQAARALAPGVGLLLVSVLVYRLLLAPSTGAYGGELTLNPYGNATIKGFINATWQFYFPRLPFMSARIGPEYGFHQVFIESFYGRFASLEVGYPATVYSLLQAASVIGLAGLAAAIVGRWATVRAHWGEVVVVVSVAVSMIGLLHAASYRALAISNDPLITGRYLLPLATVFGLTVAFVLTSLRPRASALAGTFVLSSLLALNLAGLMLTFTRFYG